MFKKKTFLVCVITLVFVAITAIAQNNPPAFGGGAPAGGGMMGGGGFSMQADPRVQNLTYVLTDTNEPMPYSLFISSKVDKEKAAPLVVMLHGLGVDNKFMMSGNVLDLAEEGGYILVSPLGYTTGGWYGITSMAQAMSGMMGGGGRGGANRGGGNRGGNRGGATPGARDGAIAPSNQNITVSQAGFGGGRGMGAGGGAGMGGMFSFGGSVGGTAETDPVKVAELSEKDVMNVLEIVRKEYKVDDKLIYLMGHSMGGAGTLHLGSKYGEIWAAIGAMAPAAFTMQPGILKKIKDMPVIIVQGDADTMVPATNTKKWADKMEELKMTYQYRELPGIDHGSVITQGMPLVFEFFANPSKSQEKASVTTSNAVATSAASGSFDGRWTGTTEIQGYGAIPFGYDFKSDGNKLTGTSDGESGPIPIANGVIDGDKITFEVTINIQGMDILVNYTGVLTGDKLKLTWPGQMGTEEVICSRQ